MTQMQPTGGNVPNERQVGQERQSLAILGGGVSGLAAALHVRALAPQLAITVFESGTRCGGVVQTESHGGFLIEQSADNFLVNDQMPWAGKLAESLGMRDALIAPNPADRRALIVKGNQTLPVPEGFYLMAAGDLADVWQSPLLSRRAKWRLWAERFVPKAPPDRDETLSEFAKRRVGREVFERLVQPLVSGIYSADPELLSTSAALPQFREMEQKYGSLTKGLRQRESRTRRTAGARYEMFRTFRRGLGSWIDRMVEQLLEHRTGVPDVQIRYRQHVVSAECVGLASSGPGEVDPSHAPHRWRITTQGSGDQEVAEFDRLISALPAPVAARVLGPASADLKQALVDIEHVGIAVVCLGYRRSQIAHPLDAFGIVVPAIEHRDAIALSFSSVKFPGRSPDGQVLLRVFLGGALRPDLVNRDENQIIGCAIQEAADILGIDGPPILERLTRWHQVTPQYHLGHALRVEKIHQAAGSLPHFAIAGNMLGGVGIPQCVHHGQLAAEEIVRTAQA